MQSSLYFSKFLVMSHFRLLLLLFLVMHDFLVHFTYWLVMLWNNVMLLFSEKHNLRMFIYATCQLNKKCHTSNIFITFNKLIPSFYDLEFCIRFKWFCRSRFPVTVSEIKHFKNNLSMIHGIWRKIFTILISMHEYIKQSKLDFSMEASQARENGQSLNIQSG